MITNPRPLTAVEVLLLCAGAAALVLVFLRVRRGPLSVSVALATAMIATVVASAPFTAWSVIADARKAREYSAFDAARVGPEDNGIDTTVVDRVARLIPSDARYEIVVSPKVGSRGGVFRVWALGVLLPRVAVEEPGKAQWVVSFGASPAELGVVARNVQVVPSQRDSRLRAWVGRIE